MGPCSICLPCSVLLTLCISLSLASFSLPPCHQHRLLCSTDSWGHYQSLLNVRAVDKICCYSSRVGWTLTFWTESIKRHSALPYKGQSHSEVSAPTKCSPIVGCKPITDIGSILIILTAWLHISIYGTGRGGWKHRKKRKSD